MKSKAPIKLDPNRTLPKWQGELSNLDPQTNELYEATVHWLSSLWFGDDREGVQKAKRFLNTTGLGIVPFAGDLATKAVRQGKPEEAALQLAMSGLPIPGAKAGAKALTSEVKTALKNTLKIGKDPEIKSSSFLEAMDKHLELNKLSTFIKEAQAAEKSNKEADLAQKLKILKNEQETALSVKSYPNDLTPWQLENFLESGFNDYDDYIEYLNETHFNKKFDETFDDLLDDSGDDLPIDPDAPDFSGSYTKPPPAQTSPTGIDTWHISNHDFDKFDINKVLSGEGTIMEGSGIYSSNNPRSKPYYVNQFTNVNFDKFPMGSPESKALDTVHNEMMASQIGQKEALASIVPNLHSHQAAFPDEYTDLNNETLKVLEEWLNKGGVPEGTIKRPFEYKLNLDIDPATVPEYRQELPEYKNKGLMERLRQAYLEYPSIYPNEEVMPQTLEEMHNEMFRANMKERGLKGPTEVGSVRGGPKEDFLSIIQTPAGQIAKQMVEKYGNIKTAFGKFASSHYLNYEPNIADDVISILNKWYDTGMPSVGRGTPRDAAADVSSYLYKKGIPGHKYLPGEGIYGDIGTRNFVSYHDEYMKILEKIKLALAAGVPIGAGLLSGGDEAQADEYDTELDPVEERHFQTWKQKHAPKDSGADYDLRGAFIKGLRSGTDDHWSDEFKKPNHPTFSNESKYAVGKDKAKAGYWKGDKFVPPRSKQQH